ncbi:SRPBCC domain-containing protein [Cryobacterium sinapicolor]|uniref:SRPBCC domain-containing protein n=1 Tax=Cryobacterium sinapicolor TaxID=1259236 RepID=A0ABY2J6L3_9MICO|nr:SRPBCC domain-containing protein [Cryobacterium sinapicolor]TFC99480.1 SRPBCC domain-containing protein [Cryobacterium sinapicolor]
MTVITANTDREALTLTFVADFNASPERVWQVWADPRQLERWWGPPTWPATFERHDFVPGGRSNYYMTGPEGEKGPGWWVTTLIQPPRRLEFEDGFADEHGDPIPEMGSILAVMTLEDVEGRTRMTTESTFQSREQMEQMAEMGMEEGMRDAMGQIDTMLAEDDSV